jgi:toxin ParE1/3/4
VSSEAWIVRLSATAEADYPAILRWTAERFGPDQVALYAATLTEALLALVAGPDTVGVKRRREIGKSLHTLHVLRGERRGRHFVLFRIGEDKGRAVIDVIRLLHDSMDLARHLPPIS